MPSPSLPRRGLQAWALLACLAALPGCSTKLPPEGTPIDARFRWAADRYDSGKYGDAAKGFLDFLTRDPLSPMADSALYMMAQSFLRDGDALRAATEFTRFAQTRPNSELADDAQLGACQSYWELSPSLPRAQDYTAQAIDECTRMLQFFPDSPRREEALALLGDARAKMAAKLHRIGKYYYDQGLYESANIYFESALDDYPDAAIVPDVLALLYASYKRLGFDAEAEVMRDRLLTRYPETDAARRVEDG
jgi:outer membrane protein assembly factor BamD